MPTRSPSTARRVTAATLASVLAFGTLASHATPAYADETSIPPTGKGITGGALLGGEVVVITESLFNVRSPLAYVIGAVLGAGAGAAGGYGVEQSSSDGKAPVIMLAAGIGLIIPAVVLTLNATRYMPTENASEDKAPTNAPPANPGLPGATPVGAAPAAAPTPPPAPTPAPAPTPPPAGGGAPPLSLFDMKGGTMRLGVPVPEMHGTFSAAEMRQYGVAQQTEVRMPIVKIAF